MNQKVTFEKATKFLNNRFAAAWRHDGRNLQRFKRNRRFFQFASSFHQSSVGEYRRADDPLGTPPHVQKGLFGLNFPSQILFDQNKPSLGITWRYLMDECIFLSIEQIENDQKERIFEVTKSQRKKTVPLKFKITNNGFEEI